MTWGTSLRVRIEGYPQHQSTRSQAREGASSPMDTGRRPGTLAMRLSGGRSRSCARTLADTIAPATSPPGGALNGQAGGGCALDRQNKDDASTSNAIGSEPAIGAKSYALDEAEPTRGFVRRPKEKPELLSGLVPIRVPTRTACHRITRQLLQATCPTPPREIGEMAPHHADFRRGANEDFSLPI